MRDLHERERMRRRVRTRVGRRRGSRLDETRRPLGVKRVILRCLLVLASLLFVLIFSVWGVCAVVFWGPSTSARDKLVTSTMEMSVGYIIPHLFLPSEMIDEIVASNQLSTSADQTDPGLVQIPDAEQPDTQEQTDEWAEHPDGIRIENIRGDTYRGYVMLIRDPSRVYVATSSDFKSGKPGLRIDDAVAREGAVAAINGGRFPDDGSTNTGYEPSGLTYSKGTCVWGGGAQDAMHTGVIGFDTNNVLIVGNMSGRRAAELGIRDCVCFGPLLVVNGEPATMTGDAGSLNPRTAIGQRADGTVIFLCVDGRMPQSLGASYADLVNIMVEFGAVNAANLDGGSSTHMIYNGEHVNVSSSLYGPRRMPTFFMVRPQTGG